MDEHVEARIAEQLRAAYDGPTIAPFAQALGVGDVAAAYRVQEINTRLWEKAGRRVVGRKIGLTAPAVQAQMGVDQPDFGILFADRQVAASGKVEDRLLQPRIEAEIALVMHEAVTDPDIGIEDFTAAIAVLRPALEIVDSRVEGWRISIVDTVADNASAGLFVLGTQESDPRTTDVVNCAMRLIDSSGVVSEGRGSACMGSPFIAGLWLAKTMIAVGRPLAAGDIVMSGALGPMKDVRLGERYEAEIEGLGKVAVRF
jgi:2-keto-4-pentenoate hydratase